MNREEMRMECLRLAISFKTEVARHSGGGSVGDPIEFAEELYKFVNRTSTETKE